MEKAKTIFLRITVCFLVFIGFVTPLLYFIIKDPFYIKQKPITTTIKVWLDTNGNGEREVDEPSLSDICVWAGDASGFQILGGWQKICKIQHFSTYSSGAWVEFLIGGNCSEVYNAINPPENYFPTTPTVVNGCSAEFGLSQEKNAFEITSQDVSLYLAKESQKKEAIFGLKIGVSVLLIFIFAVFISFRTVRPVNSKIICQLVESSVDRQGIGNKVGQK